MNGKFRLLLMGKASSHSTALPSFFLFFFCAAFSCLIIIIIIIIMDIHRFHTPPAVRPTLLRQMDMGPLTCAHIWVCAVSLYTRMGVRHKQVCTRVDLEGQKKTTVPHPTPPWDRTQGLLSFELRACNHCELRPPSRLTSCVR